MRAGAATALQARCIELHPAPCPLPSRGGGEGACYFFPPVPMLPAELVALGAFSFFGLRFSLLDFI